MTDSLHRGPVPIDPGSSLAALACDHAGASRVFHRHHLDFCCQGARTLADACRAARVPVDLVLAELRSQCAPVASTCDWRELPRAQLITHIVEAFHADHRRELPRLCQLAEKVERVHAARPECPHGLAAHLHAMQQRLEEHMEKEEKVLFPLLVAGADHVAGTPIRCLTAEHDDHAADLRRVRELTHDNVPPPDACSTWRALYLGLTEFERRVMEHVHLENHVLFPSAGG
jgi:regulator of cell morphogenesis and NO signaling